MQIKFSDVSHVYQTVGQVSIPAIKNITVDLSEQSMVAIVGHTGSGKSTAMQHINGLLQPTSGKMHVSGTVITHKKNRDLALVRRHIGYVFQNPAYQLFANSVLEDVMYGPLNFGFTQEEAERSAKESLATVGISEALYHAYPFDLSGGQMRKVALAGAIAYQPEVLILDEPTVGLDPLATQELIELLDTLHTRSDKSVIFISHDMEFVYQVAKRVLVFFEGQLVFDGTPYQLFSDASLLKQYALAMPELFQLAHELHERGIKLELTEQNFSLANIIATLRVQKELK